MLHWTRQAPKYESARRPVRMCGFSEGCVRVRARRRLCGHLSRRARKRMSTICAGALDPPRVPLQVPHVCTVVRERVALLRELSGLLSTGAMNAGALATIGLKALDQRERGGPRGLSDPCKNCSECGTLEAQRAHACGHM
eukprot:14016783-Alexandrium_andersonii.AAC.1